MKAASIWVLPGILSAVLAAPAWSQPTDGPDRTDDPTLYMVGYAHLDTQWRWSYLTTIGDYIPRTLRDNFSLFSSYPDYIFNFSGSRRYRMMKEYYPADYATLQQYVAAGRWFTCGSSVDECDSLVPSAESLIRQILYGSRYFQDEFDTTSAEFMLPDCFGFPASLPSILGHCGIRGFSTQKLTWGSAVGIPFNVGVWEGLDGVSVLAALNPGAYVSSIDHDLSEDSGWLNRINGNGTQSGVYADYSYYGTGDIGGAPSEGSVQWLETSVNGTGPVTVLSATAEQMFLDVPGPELAPWPRYTGDLLLTEHSAGSITSQGYMKRWNFKNELLADAAERASVFAEWLGGPAYPAARLVDAWYLVLGSQMHDILPGTSIPYAYDLSWNDEIIALNQFAEVLTNAVGSVTAGIDTQAEGVPLVVYNPLSIEREDVVEATVAMPGPAPAAIRVFGPDGSETPSQMLSAEDGNVKVLFLARVPSVGFAVFDVRAAAAPAGSSLSVTSNSLENDRYLVTLDVSGDVSSIFDKAAGRELLNSPARLAFSEDTPSYWPAWSMYWDDAQRPPIGYVSGSPTVRIVEDGAARVAVEIERESMGSTFVQTIRLAAGEAGDRIEFDNTIGWHSAQVNLKAEFPLTVSNPIATYNWEVGKIARGTNDPSKFEVPTHMWLDLTDTSGDYGVSVLTDSKYGSDKPGDQTVRLTLLRTPSAVVFEDQGSQDWGTHEILYGLSGHTGDWGAGNTDWQALRMSQPLLAFQTTPHAGALGRSRSILSVNDPGVRVMALKKAERSDEWIVRIVELYGELAGNVTVSFPATIVSAREVDGREEPLGPASFVGNALITSLTPYTLRTFAVTLGPPPTQLPAVQQAAVPLPYDADVTCSDGEPAVDGFDFAGRSLPAEELPQDIPYNGLDFLLGPVTGGDMNAVRCSGQAIALPAGDYNRLYLLAASSGADHEAEFSVDGAPHTLKIQPWRGYIGQWYSRIWAGSQAVGLNPAYVRRDPVAWYASHHHTAAGTNVPYAYCYLFAYSLPIASGGGTLTLPDDDQIVLLAATLADDPAADTTPAQPLYDDIEEGPVSPQPTMNPVGLTGWNQDVVVENTAVAPYGDDASHFDVPNGFVFYESGLEGGDSHDGLPIGGEFYSLVNPATRVRLRPYDAPNVLLLDALNGPNSGTLTFDVGERLPYSSLAIFACSANSTQFATGTVTIHFTNGSSSDPLGYSAFDWFYHTADNAIANLGRLNINNDEFDPQSGNDPRIYQTTLDLTALELDRLPIESLTFTVADGPDTRRSTGIFAVSGAQHLNLDSIPVALNYNWNGIVHTPAERGIPDAPNGYRSISDRGLYLLDGYGPTLPTATLGYQFVETPGVLDIVALANRNTVDNGRWTFDASPDGDAIGIRPNWLAHIDQSSVTTVLDPPVQLDESARVGVLYNYSNGGGDFDVTLGFQSGSSVTLTVNAPDWYGARSPGPAGAGVESQLSLGTFPAVANVDQADVGPDLNIIEAVATRGRILADLGVDIAGESLASITFDNRSTSGSAAIFATTVAVSNVPDCPGDFDGDNDVDLTDLTTLLSDYGCTGGCVGDLDGDNDTDLTDLTLLLANFGTMCP